MALRGLPWPTARRIRIEQPGFVGACRAASAAKPHLGRGWKLVVGKRGGIWRLWWLGRGPGGRGGCAPGIRDAGAQLEHSCVAACSYQLWRMLSWPPATQAHGGAIGAVSAGGSSTGWVRW